MLDDHHPSVDLGDDVKLAGQGKGAARRASGGIHERRLVLRLHRERLDGVQVPPAHLVANHDGAHQGDVVGIHAGLGLGMQDVLDLDEALGGGPIGRPPPLLKA